jgi:dTDP-4-dehydrorhamnose reductase
MATRRWLITGAGGTLGRAVVRAVQAAGGTAVPWPRHSLDPLRPAGHARWIDDHRIDAIVHLALASQPTGAPDEGQRINLDWPLALATIAAERKLPMVFTSTAMVYDASADGPYTLASPPTPRNDYGAQKLQAEHGVLLRHASGARVARLGWQIDPTRDDGNQMVAHAFASMRSRGRVDASRVWRPACSFVDDTAAALVRLVDQPPGVYLFDSNADGVTFDRLLTALSSTYGFGWNVVGNEDYRHDQRMVDPRGDLPSLGDRLPCLFTGTD